LEIFEVFETYLEDGKQVYVTKTLPNLRGTFLSVAFLMVTVAGPEVPNPGARTTSVPMSTAARGDSSLTGRLLRFSPKKLKSAEQWSWRQYYSVSPATSSLIIGMMSSVLI